MRTVTLQNLAIGYIAVWSVSPPLFGSDIARLLVIFSTATWIFLEISRPGGIAYTVTVPILLTLLFISYTGTFEALLYGAEGVIRGIQIWIMLFFLIVGQSRRNDLQSLVPVFWSVLAVYPVWLFITFETLITTNGHAARTIVRASAEAEALTEQGVGGYGLVYGTLLFIPLLLGLLRNRKVLNGGVLPRPLRIFPGLAFGLVALNFGLGVAVVLTAGFTIAVIALIGILFSFFLFEKYNATRFLFAFLAMLVVTIFAKSILEAALLALQPLAEGTSYAWKIRDMLLSIQIGDASGTAAVRSERYIRSLLIFEENPLFGVLARDDVGKHSQFLDGFARWGAIFGGIFVYLVSFPALRAIRHGMHEFGVGLAMLVGIVVIFGLNNGFASAGLMIYIIFPVSMHILKNGYARPAQTSVVKPLA